MHSLVKPTLASVNESFGVNAVKPRIEELL